MCGLTPLWVEMVPRVVENPSEAVISRIAQGNTWSGGSTGRPPGHQRPRRPARVSSPPVGRQATPPSGSKGVSTRRCPSGGGRVALGVRRQRPVCLWAAWAPAVYDHGTVRRARIGRAWGPHGFTTRRSERFMAILVPPHWRGHIFPNCGHTNLSAVEIGPNVSIQGHSW